MALKMKLLASNCQVAVLAREYLILLLYCSVLALLLGYLSIASISDWRFYCYLFFVIIVCTFIFRVHRAYSTKRWFSQRVSPLKKAILITGCDTGFGFETAKRLNAKGFHIFACCLDPERHGGPQLRGLANTTVIKVDVSSVEDVKQSLEIVAESLGENELWAVINNAGIGGAAELQAASLSEAEKVLDVNLLGTVRVTKTFLPLLLRSKGRLINVASAAGRLRMPGFIAYTTSKAGIIAFTDTLRLELQKHGLSVVTIEPWMYQTQLANPSSLARRIKKQWTENVESSNSTEDYVTNVQSKTSSLFSWCINPNISEVVDVMEDAVTRDFPPYHYRPGRWYFNLFLWTMSRLPQPLADYILWDFVFKC